MLEHRIQKAVFWAEDHLPDDFSSGDLAGIACLSEYHFRRVFTAMTGISPGLYIKRRRLTRAADALAQDNKRILDIAMESGFESQESFSRAFKDMFGVSPAQHRKSPDDLSRIVQPPMDLAYLNHIQKGMITMTPDIKTRNSFCVAGLGDDYILGQTKEIPALWDRFMQRRPELHATGTIDYGICSKSSGKDSFHYTAATEIKEGALIPDGMETIVIPTSTYAVFTHKGPLSSFEKTIEYVWKIWLPKSHYTLADSPDFELYDERFDPVIGSGEIEIWLPVKE